MSWRAETGYVFNRDLDYDSATPDVSPGVVRRPTTEPKLAEEGGAAWWVLRARGEALAKLGRHLATDAMSREPAFR